MSHPCCQQNHAGCLLLACLLLASTPLQATDATSTNAGNDLVRSLRVFAVRPRVFEYLFTGAVSGTRSNATPLLQFRDLAGNAPVVRILDALGAYTVTSFTPHTARIFRESVNTTLDEDASTVTLRDAAGSNRILTAGQPLVEPGLMACIVSLSSGGWGNLREGDALNVEGAEVTVIHVAATAATIRAASTGFEIPLVTDAERQSVLALWESHRQEAEAQQAQALAQAAEKQRQAERLAKANAAAPPETAAKPAPAATPACTFGTEGCYPVVYGPGYPTHFIAVPYTYYWPNGQSTTQTILVPDYFDRHHGGDGHWRH